MLDAGANLAFDLRGASGAAVQAREVAPGLLLIRPDLQSFAIRPLRLLRQRFPLVNDAEVRPAVIELGAAIDQLAKLALGGGVVAAAGKLEGAIQHGAGLRIGLRLRFASTRPRGRRRRLGVAGGEGRLLLRAAGARRRGGEGEA